MKRLVGALAVALIAVAGVWLAGSRGWISIPLLHKTIAGPSSANANEPAVPVVVAEARYANVPVKLDGVGTIQALNSILIRSQVEGRLVKLALKEGQDVTRGEVIAQIDPAPYRATHEQAVAKKAQDEATLANAKIDLERASTLLERGFGPRQQYDTQRALVDQLSALVQADQAAIDNAKAYLDYTTIRSPIDGRAGIRLVDEGNLIRASDPTGIVTIAQIRPIALIFNVPQQQFRAVNEASLRGAVKVQAIGADNATVLAEGQIDAIDNQVDQQTGTVKIRARFANENLSLWPGQFVNVRVFTDVLQNVAVVPSGAVQRGPLGSFVYRVSDEERAILTPILVSHQDNQFAVVSSGLSPPVRVVTTGFQRLRDRTKIKVSPAENALSLADQNQPRLQ